METRYESGREPGARDCVVAPIYPGCEGMDHEQKSGAGLLQMLQLLWLLPHSWALPAGKPLAPLCVRPEGSEDDNRLRGEGLLFTDGKPPTCCTRPVCVLATFQTKKRDPADLRDLCEFPTWEKDRAGVGTK